MAVGIAACGGATKKPTQRTFPSANQPAAALIQLSGLLDANGTLSVSTAQRLFAAYVAPLPGVEPLTLPAPVPEDIGGMAIRRLSPGAPGVTPETSAAVQRALASLGGESVDIPAHGPGKARAAQVPSASELRSKLAAIRDRLQELSGYTLTNPIRARIVPDRVTRGAAWSEAIGEPSRTATCMITIPQTIADGSMYRGDTASVTSTLAHEVWHCFQLSSRPSAWASGPAWIIEGQAEYAGEAYVGGSGSSQGPWDTWLLTPDASLFRRSYDAIGIYALSAARGANPWRTMLAMLGQSGPTAVETLFGSTPASTSVLLDAESLVRASRFGAEWETTGPGVTGARATSSFDAPVGDAATRSVTLGRYAALPFELHLARGDVLTLIAESGVGGAVAFPGIGTVKLGVNAPTRFCLRDGGCACPDGSQPGGGADTLPHITGSEGVAALAALEGGPVVLRTRIANLDQACNKLVGEWEAPVGDVLRSIEGSFGGAMPNCVGPYHHSFRADGSWAMNFRMTCPIGGVANAGVGTGSYAGFYTADATEVYLERITGSGSATIMGRPIGSEGSFLRYPEGRGSYVVAADKLTLTFAIPGRASVVITLQRVG